MQFSAFAYKTPIPDETLRQNQPVNQLPATLFLAVGIFRVVIDNSG